MPIREKIAKSAVRVITRLHDAGFEAFLVGGAVRDLILDIEPKDYDIATNATPEEIRGVFGRRSRIIGRRFRLAHVYMDRRVFEVSTFRREPTMEERKGRKTDDGLIVWRDNEFGTVEQDARRRDFTVNAIYYDPQNTAHQFTDFVDGLADMEAKLVRTIGKADIRMAEDPVRMLRALKLVGQYGFTPTDSVRDAIRAGAEQIKLCSAARLLEELYKVLKKPYCVGTLSACEEYGLLEHLLPKLSKAWHTPVGDDILHLLEVRDRMLSAGEVYPSRVTGACAMLLPMAANAFRKHCQDDSYLWSNFASVDKKLQLLIKEFLSPYLVPRYIVAKIRDVLLLQPKLLAVRNRKRVMRHPEYNRARDLFRICVQAYDLPPEAMDPWPEVEQPRRGRRRL